MRKSLGKKIPVLGSKPSPKHSGENVVSIHLEGGVHALDSRSTAENPVQSNCKEIQDGVHPGMKIFSGITAIVDCALTNGEITSVGVAEKLSRFGASIVKKWNEKVTHLIWINGQNRKLLEKVFNSGDPLAFIVSPLWVEKCIESGKCVDEMDFLICVDPTMFLKVKKPRLSTVKEEMGEKISSKKNKNLKKKEDDNDQENSDFNIDKTNFTEHELRDEFRIIFSSTQSTKKPFLYEACSSLPNTEIIFSHEDPVTHVVLDKPKRTLKVLFGIARGAWIVDSQWVLDAFSFGKFPNEEKYECSLWPGASISRRLRENNDGNLLLHRLKIFVFYNGQDPDLGAAISELVLLLGGILETNIDNCEICITSESCLENMNEGFMNSKTGESPRILRHEWLFDSISEYKLMPYDEYAILHVEDSAELDSPEV